MTGQDDRVSFGFMVIMSPSAGYGAVTTAPSLLVTLLVDRGCDVVDESTASAAMANIEDKMMKRGLGQLSNLDRTGCAVKLNNWLLEKEAAIRSGHCNSRSTGFSFQCSDPWGPILPRQKQVTTVPSQGTPPRPLPQTDSASSSFSTPEAATKIPSAPVIPGAVFDDGAFGS